MLKKKKKSILLITELINIAVCKSKENDKWV